MLDGMTIEYAINLMQQALIVIIQLVTKPIMTQITNFTSAHEMWVYLRENYYTDTYFSGIKKGKTQ